MNDVAFLFPGQGSQSPGMGRRLAEAHREAQLVFEEADDVLGFPLSRLCFDGPEDDLKQTENTQPALLAVSVAAERVLAARGIRPAIAAGHSLGEYSALVALGSLRFADALRLVRQRGRFMQQAVPAGIGAMAALLKLPEGRLDEILKTAAQDEVVTAANFNSPDQTVIAGHTAAVERAMELAKAAGARRAVRLSVSAPFHCPLMLPAQQQLAPALDATQFADPAVPLVNNWRAELVQTGAEARRGLYEQIPHPVRWTESIQNLYHFGSRRFIEVGAGSVLLGLVRSIEPDLRGVKFGEPADMETLEALIC